MRVPRARPELYAESAFSLGAETLSTSCLNSCLLDCGAVTPKRNIFSHVREGLFFRNRRLTHTLQCTGKSTRIPVSVPTHSVVPPRPALPESTIENLNASSSFAKLQSRQIKLANLLFLTAVYLLAKLGYCYTNAETFAFLNVREFWEALSKGQ
jgi:hypothetical protein